MEKYKYAAVVFSFLGEAFPTTTCRKSAMARVPRRKVLPRGKGAPAVPVPDHWHQGFPWTQSDRGLAKGATLEVALEETLTSGSVDIACHLPVKLLEVLKSLYL
jgi:hypothetical protein